MTKLRKWKNWSQPVRFVPMMCLFFFSNLLLLRHLPIAFYKRNLNNSQSIFFWNFQIGGDYNDAADDETLSVQGWV